MAGKSGPETRLVKKMRDAGRAKYGTRLVTVKYHGSEYGEAGVSDLLIVLDGVFGACEVKAPESYGDSVERALQDGPSLKQRAFIARVQEAGGIGWVAATVEGFMEGLEAMAFQARRAMPLAEDTDVICTCVTMCEHETENGCYYCRTADKELPCPNLDKEEA